MKNLTVLIFSLAIIVSSCAPPQHGSSSSSSSDGYNGIANTGITKQGIGAIAGAIGGAFVGSNVGKGSGRTVGIAAGTLLGGLLGSEIGKSLDRADMAYYQKTAQNTLESQPTGTTSRWINPDSGNSGTVTPTRTYQTSSGSYCREFTQTIVIGGEKQEAFGTACRQSDGSWRVVNS